MGQPNWFIDIIRILFRLLDHVAYWLVDIIYQLFIMISEAGVFSPETIGKFAGRIYALLGIFMVFKVSFSLITYILNPDSFTDKNKGIGKIVTNFFVVLIGIVAVPYVFQAAYGLQGIILRENVIGNLIMGGSSASEASGENYIQKGGDLISFTTLSAFMRLNPNLFDDECAGNPVTILRDSSGNLEMDGDYPAAKISDACANNSKSDGMKVSVNNGQLVDQLLVEAYRTNNTNFFTQTDLVTLKSSDSSGTEYYIIDYTFLISTVVGAFLAWILMLFCIDIATRSVKLGFLQLIAPIPIISYIDPKGQDIFKKWIKESAKTYADIFMRLAAIYFVIFIISELDIGGGYYNVVTGDVQKVNSFGTVAVKIFIIFGALMFAKEVPTLIGNILGIKFSGGFTLNPMKKLGQSPFAAGLIGAAGGALGGMASNALAAKWKGAGFGGTMKNIGSMIAGGTSAGLKGGYAGLTAGGKGSALDSASKGIKISNANRNLRAKGYGLGDKLGDRISSFAGTKYAGGTTSKLKSEINDLQQKLSDAKMNEQSYSDVLARKMGETNSRDSIALRRVFDRAVAERDSKGNIVKYQEKTYDDYRMAAAEQEAIRHNEDWATMDDSRKQIYLQTAEYNGLISEEEFNSMNEMYNQRNHFDVAGRDYQKQINDYQDDINQFKDRNKK